MGRFFYKCFILKWIGCVAFGLTALLSAASVRDMALSLEEAEQVALTENKQLKELEELYKRAKEGKLAAIADYLPKLEAISEGYRTQEVQKLTSQSKNSFLTQLSLTQSLLSTDKYYDIKLAELMVKQLEILLKSLVNDILFDVRDQYYKLISIEKQVLIAQTHVEILNILSKRVEDRLAIGTTTSFEVNQSKVALSNALSLYYDQVKNKKVGFNLFALYLGFDPGRIKLVLKEKEIPLYSIEDIHSKLDRFKTLFTKEPISYGLIYQEDYLARKEGVMHTLFTPKEYHYWEDITLKYRPALMQAENHVHIAHEKVNKMKGKYAPSLDFVANFGGAPSPYFFYPTSNLTNQTFEWGVGFELKWLLFDSLKREREVKMARFETRSKKHALGLEVQRAFKDVRDEIAKMEDATANYVSSEGVVALAEQMLAQAEERVEIGTISIFDYQYAVDSFVQAENIFTTSQYNLISAYVGLRHASGIDVERGKQYYEGK